MAFMLEIQRVNCTYPMKNKKILMFVNVDWFYVSHRAAIGKGLCERAYEFQIYAERTNKIDQDLADLHKIIDSPIKRDYRGLLLEISSILKLLYYFIVSRPAMVHAVTIKPILFTGLLCYVLKIPFLASISGLGPIFQPASSFDIFRMKLIVLLYKIIFSSKKCFVLCQSQSDADYIINQVKVDKDIVKIIKGSGVDLRKHSIERKANDHINVVMASRILKKKGVGEYLNAAGLISQKKSDVRFFLAGPLDASSDPWVDSDELVRLCGVNNVTYLGDVKDLNKVLNNCDFFVLPSYYPEGIPKVLLEAIASGCYIVTTDHAGCRDVITSSNIGTLVKPNDTEALTDALLKVLNNGKLSREKRKLIRLDAEAFYDENSVVERHLQLYQKLVGY